jgi:hypothetical protein
MRCDIDFRLYQQSPSTRPDGQAYQYMDTWVQERWPVAGRLLWVFRSLLDGSPQYS